jgi:hypothetical protein
LQLSSETFKIFLSMNRVGSIIFWKFQVHLAEAGSLYSLTPARPSLRLFSIQSRLLLRPQWAAWLEDSGIVPCEWHDPLTHSPSVNVTSSSGFSHLFRVESVLW